MAHPLSIKLKLGASSSASSSTPTSTPASLAVPHHIPQPSLEPVGPSYSQSQSPAAAPAPAPARPQQPPAAPAPAPPPPTAAAVREGEGEQEVEGERPVAATKYRELKRKLILQTTVSSTTPTRRLCPLHLGLSSHSASTSQTCTVLVPLLTTSSPYLSRQLDASPLSTHAPLHSVPKRHLTRPLPRPKAYPPSPRRKILPIGPRPPP